MQVRRTGMLGFTLIELMVVITIIGIFAALAVPAFDRWSQTQHVKNAVRSVADAFHIARSSAIQSGNNHIVFLNANGGTDACGNALNDVNGNPVPIVILNDGAPGSPQQNCCIGPLETFTTRPAEIGVNWGVTNAAAAVPSDPGAGSMLVGSTFADQNSAQRSWVMFRPDGVPVGFTGACTAGGVGTGGGAVYITDGNNDFAAVLSPLGGVKVHGYERVSGTWTN